MLYKAKIVGYLVYLDRSYPERELYSKTTIFNRVTKRSVNTYAPIFSRLRSGEYIIGLGAFRILYNKAPRLFIIETTNPMISILFDVPLPKGLVLREYQEECLNTLLSSKGGVTRLPTGTGKGTIAVALANSCLQNGHVLLLSPTSAAQDTMKSRCEYYNLPFITYFESRTKTLDKYHIIGTIPISVCNDIETGNNSLIRDNIKTVIADECHHLKASTWHTIFRGLSKVERSYGFSATVSNSSDDFPSMNIDTSLMISYSGPVIYSRQAKDPDISKYLDIPDVYEIEYKWDTPIQGNNWTKIAKAIETNVDRQKFIASIINEVCRLGFTCLSVVSRISVANTQFKYIDSNSIKWFGAGVWEGKDVNVVGKSILDYVKSNLRTNIMSIIATNHLNEAADIPELDVVILSENVDPTIVVQRSGRIVRKGDKKSKVINIVDKNAGVLEYQSKKRVAHLVEEYGVATKKITLEELKDNFK